MRYLMRERGGPPPPHNIITYQRYFKINLHVTHKVREKELFINFEKINGFFNKRNIALLNTLSQKTPPYLRG